MISANINTLRTVFMNLRAGIEPLLSNLRYSGVCKC